LKIKVNQINSYSLEDFKIEQSPISRDWMKANKNHAYKCLPLKIANKFGWNILCPIDFSASWNGKTSHKDSFKLKFNTKNKIKANQYIKDNVISSHFGDGILTFSLPYLFRTPKEVGLFIRGPTNYPKFNITYLDGFIETDWLNFTFTYNIKFQKPNIEVNFKKGEPICTIFPFKLSSIENVEFIYTHLIEDENLYKNYKEYSKMRAQFNKYINQENINKEEIEKIYGSAHSMKDYHDGENAKRKEIGCPFLNKFGKFLHRTNLNLKSITNAKTL